MLNVTLVLIKKIQIIIDKVILNNIFLVLNKEKYDENTIIKFNIK